MASIAVVGGTGHLGKGIARRLARAGHTVTIGSRSAEKAEAAAEEMGGGIGFGANSDVVAGKDVVFVTVPYENQEATLKQIAPLVGTAIVVDTTVPLDPAQGDACATARCRLRCTGGARIPWPRHSLCNSISQCLGPSA